MEPDINALFRQPGVWLALKRGLVSGGLSRFSRSENGTVPFRTVTVVPSLLPSVWFALSTVLNTVLKSAGREAATLIVPTGATVPSDFRPVDTELCPDRALFHSCGGRPALDSRPARQLY